MPIFEYEGKKYNVQDQHVSQFAKDFPDATSILERDGKKYRVKSADFGSFMEESQPQQQETPMATSATPNNEEYITGFGQGVKQGTQQLAAGVKYAGGEALDLVTKTAKDNASALAALDKMQAEGKDVAQETKRDAKSILLPLVGHSAPAIDMVARVFGKKNPIAKANAEVANDKIIRKALEETNGDVEAARALLEQRANEQTTADEWRDEAAQVMNEAKPTKGAGAWVGNMIPQMAGTAAGLGLSAITKSPLPAQILGLGQMGALTASTAGASMKEARDAGATNGEVWATGLADAAIEFATEAIPFKGYLSPLVKQMKSKTGKAIADVIVDKKSPARKELQNLLDKANAQLGGKLFTAESAAKYIDDVLKEGASEFTAEALQTITPMLYAEPENYPTLWEVFGNGIEGLKGGIFMGSVLGGVANAATNKAQRDRRKEQGFVNVAEVKVSEDSDETTIAEVIDYDAQADRASILINGEIMPLDNASKNVVNQEVFTFEEFDRGQVDMEHAESYDRGRNIATPQEKNDALNDLEAQEANIRQRYSLDPDADVYEFMGGDPIAYAMNETDTELRSEILDLVNAKAVYDGMTDGINERIATTIEESDRLIDSHINKDDNLIHAAILKGVDENSDRKVYIISGAFARNEDGTIDTTDLAEGASMIVKDATTGKSEFIDPRNLKDIAEAIDPAEEKQRAAETITNEIATKEEAEIAGTLAFVPNDVYTIADENGVEHTATIVADNQDGNVQVILDNAQEPMLMSKEKVQQMADAYNIGRANAKIAEKKAQSTIADSSSEETTPMVENVEPKKEVPVLKNGQPDFNAMDAEMFVNEYASRYGEESATKIARKNISSAREEIAKIDKKIDDITDPNQMQGLFDKKAEAEARLNRYVDILDRMGMSEDANETEADQKTKLRNEAGNKIVSLFPDGLPNVESFILADIATGNRVRWSDKETNGAVTSRGLGAELGLSGSNKERVKRLALISNDAMTPEEYAESLRERLDAAGIRYDETALRDDVINTYASVDTRKGAWEALENIANRANEQEQELMDWEDAQQRIAYEKAKNAVELPAVPDLATIEEEVPEVPVELGASFDENINEIENIFNDERSTENTDVPTSVSAEDGIADGDQTSIEMVQSTGTDNTLGDSGSSEEQGSNEGNVGEGIADVPSADVFRAEEVDAATPQLSAKEEMRRKPLRARAKMWEAKVGVPVHLIETFEEVPTEDARKAILDGKVVTAWVTDGEVYLYMPYLRNRTEVDKTYIHEVVAHVGMKRLLGKEGYRQFCMRVYNEVMTEVDRKFYDAYPNVKNHAQAADEYIAHLSEDTDMESSIWQKVVRIFRDALRVLGIETALTNKDIQDLIRDSYKNLTNEENVADVDEGKTRFSIKGNDALSNLHKASSTIHKWIENNVRGKSFQIELPESVSRQVRREMGRDFESHNITANGIAHALKNHGVNGLKLTESSIPLRKKDMELIPYIMVAPDRVSKGTADASGRESVRFYKTINNGSVVVVEKEYKNSKDDMETITMWAEMSPQATNAQSTIAPDTHARNAILSTDIAKIIQDAENAIEKEQNIQFRIEKPSLVGLHNISEEKLRKALKMGGLANPSVAVIDVDKNDHTDYGDYSLVLSKNMVDSRLGKNAGTWSGDAWTPTYPQVTKRMSKDKNISRYYKDISTLPEAIRGKVRLDFDSYMDGRSANALAYWYLFEKGEAPELVNVPARYPEDVVDTINEATNGSFSMFGLSAEDRAKCVDAYVAYEYNGDRVAYDAEMDARKKRLENFAKSHEKAFIRKKAQEDLDAINEYGFDYDVVSRFIHDVEWDVRHKGEVDVDATIKASMDYITENNLGAEYDAWRDNLDERYGIKEYIFDGYTNSGTPRYLPHTIENASKWMKKQGRQGAVATFPSFGTFVAVSIPKMTTLDSIRKRKNSLGKSKEEYDAFREKWENVYYELGKKLQPDARGFDDYGYWRLIEAVGQRNPKEYIKKQYNIELSKEDTNTLNEMLDAIRNEYPARYFETKFERPINIREFVGAVVPENIPSDIEAELLNAGLNIYKYDPQKEGSRREATLDAVDSDDIRFRVVDPAPTFYSNAERAAENVKQEKATPEQWLKMIEKNGGLKAGEDKWLGLSDWLKSSDKKTLTKQEVLDFIKENQIQIEEVVYGDVQDLSAEDIQESDEFAALVDSLTDYEIDENGDEYPYINRERYQELRNGSWNFSEGFSVDYWGEGLDIESVEAAAEYLGVSTEDRNINETRLKYTTDGLENKREIALVVPTIESWNAYDDVHFGDAGNGRAIAWVRFGEAKVPIEKTIVKRVLLDAPYKDVNSNDVYKIKETRNHFIVNKNLRNGERKFVPYVNDKPIGTTIETAAFDTLEEASMAMQNYYNEHPYKYMENQRVLVIDEVQSKRHQEGREKGYRENYIKNEFDLYLETLTAKYGQNWVFNDLSETDQQKLMSYSNRADVFKEKGVPSAPFEKNWAELAMKRMLRYAAENGFDKIAWTTGEQQAERYSLGAVMQGLTAYKTSPNTYYVIPYNNGAIGEFVKEYTEKELAETFGKEIAVNIITNAENATEENPYEMTGDDLRIGGSGMKAFYDQMIPSFMNKYGKKWGVKVGEVTMPSLEENNTMHSIDVTDAMRESVMQGQPMFRISDYDRQFDALQSEYDALDKNDAKALNEWREKKTSAVRDYLTHIKDRFGMRSELIVFNGADEEQMRDAYNKVVASYEANGNMNPPTYEAFKEKSLRKDMVAMYRKNGDTITFNATADDLNDKMQFAETMFHEDAHRVSYGLYTSDEFETIWKDAKKSKDHVVKEVEKLYAKHNNVQKGKEYIAKAVGYLANKQKDSFMQFLKGEIPVEELLKKLHGKSKIANLAVEETLNVIKDEYRVQVSRRGDTRRMGGVGYGSDLQDVGVVLQGNGGTEQGGSADRDSRYRVRVLDSTLADMVGEESYNKFLDGVFRDADDSIRREMVNRAMQNGLDFRTATQEYLANLVNENVDSIFLSEVKDLYVGTLEDAGIDMGDISDNELRYALWKNNQKDNGVFSLAEDVVMRSKLGVGNYTQEADIRPRYTDSEAEETSFRIREQEPPKNTGVGYKVFVLKDGKLYPPMVANPDGADTPVGVWLDADAAPVSGTSKTGRSQVKAGGKGTQGGSGTLAYRPGWHLGTIPYALQFNRNNPDTGKRELFPNNFVWAEVDYANDVDYQEEAMSYGYNKNGKFQHSYAGLPRVPENGSYTYRTNPNPETDPWVITGAMKVNRLLPPSEVDEMVVAAGRTPQERQKGAITDADIVKFNNDNGLAQGEADTQFRVAPSTPSTGKARQMYDEAVRSHTKKNNVKKSENLWHHLREAYQDSMLSVQKLMDAVLAETGNTLRSSDDVYKAENQLSSKNKAEIEKWERDFMKPLQIEILDLIKKGASYDDIVEYLLAKHGLERNLEFSRREAEEDGKVWDGFVKRDFSGLTELTGEAEHFTKAAQQIVEEFEGKYNTDNLWSKINAATKESLKKSYDSGLMSKETYDKVVNMFQYYIPLRGWDNNVAADQYEYMANKGMKILPALKTAKGRTSRADDPIATLGSVGESSIIQGNRNLMKQKFLNFAQNNPTSLLTVDEQWYEQNADGTWKPSNPKIPTDATADEVDAIIKAHEAEMEALGDKATKKRQGLNINLHTTKWEEEEHAVNVKRNGKEYKIYVNGNPIAAQAINGFTNPNANKKDSWEWIEQRATAVKNFMARAFTSMNPAFVLSNLARDIIWAGTSVAIKENAGYARQYSKNISKAMTSFQLPSLVSKWKKGTLDMNDPIEKYFHEFITNGGETGFTQLNTVDDYKRNMERFIKEAQGGVTTKAKKGWRWIWDNVEFLNRSAEDTTRFMVYLTSRQMGRPISESIANAKDITVNFNKKGRGTMGANVLGFAYIFFNATIQSLANFGKLIANHPKKTVAALTTFGASGMITPMVALAVQAMLSGDDDEPTYWDLPEWVRRNNIVIYVGGSGYVTIPLPHELRPFYGMGELAFSTLMGKEEPEVALQKAVEGFAGLMPFDFTGNAGNAIVNFTPTIAQPLVQLAVNKDYFGTPIYRKTAFNEQDPEWTKAYKSTNQLLVDATEFLNELTGGDEVKNGLIDLNPAVIEHLYEGYLGGMGKTINRAAKTFSMLWDEDARTWRNVPVASSFYQVSDERTSGSQVNREYFDAVDEADAIEHLYSGYRKRAKMGIEEYAEKLNELIESDAFKRYQKVNSYKKAIAKMNTILKEADPTDREDIETRIMELKVDMLEELDAMDIK